MVVDSAVFGPENKKATLADYAMNAITPKPESETSTNLPPEMASEGSKRSANDSQQKPKPGTYPNNVRKLRQAAMMSKAELARRAGVSPLTINRVEAGCPCRMDTKRKILEALGLDPSARENVFGPDVDQV